MTGRLLAYLLDTKRLIPGKPMHFKFPMRDTKVDHLDPSYLDLSDKMFNSSMDSVGISFSFSG